MKTKVSIFLFFLLSHGFVWGQVYYPKIDFFSHGTLINQKISGIQDSLFLYKYLPNFPERDSVICSIQSVNQSGEISELQTTNHIIISDTNLLDVYFVEVKNMSKNANNPLELILLPTYAVDSANGTSTPIHMVYNRDTKTIDTTLIHWNFDNFGVFDALKVDSFYYLIVIDNMYSNLRKDWIVKTDQNFNILKKYRHPDMFYGTANLYYWNHTILLYGDKAEYEPELGNEVGYPAIYFYDEVNLTLQGSKSFKIKWVYHSSQFGSLNATSDSILIGFTSLPTPTNFIFALDKNFNFVDSLALVPGTKFYGTILHNNCFYGITYSYSNDSLITIFSYDPTTNKLNHKFYNIGVRKLSDQLSLVKINNSLNVYGTTPFKNNLGTTIGFSCFRFALDSNGIPIESRQAPTLVEEAYSNEEIKITPNPNQGSFQISFNKFSPNKTQTLTLYNTFGQLVFTENLKEQNPIFHLNLIPGTYYIRVNTEDKVYFQKMVVSH